MVGGGTTEIGIEAYRSNAKFDTYKVDNYEVTVNYDAETISIETIGKIESNGVISFDKNGEDNVSLSEATRRGKILGKVEKMLVERDLIPWKGGK